MFKKIVLSAALAMSSVVAFAHDEGHGPKIRNQGKYGGRLSSVIFKKDANNSSAKAEYAAELTSSSDGTLRLYLYDTKLQPVSLSPKQVTGNASYKSKETRKSTTSKIDFKQNGDSFESKLPADIDGTVSLEVDIATKNGDYMAAFPRIK
jgi:hypothetical protein